MVTCRFFLAGSEGGCVITVSIKSCAFCSHKTLENLTELSAVAAKASLESVAVAKKPKEKKTLLTIFNLTEIELEVVENVFTKLKKNYPKVAFCKIRFHHFTCFRHRLQS
jgi:hypothetical protein